LLLTPDSPITFVYLRAAADWIAFINVPPPLVSSSNTQQTKLGSTHLSLPQSALAKS